MNLNEQQSKPEIKKVPVPIYDKKKKQSKGSKSELKIIKNGPNISILPQPQQSGEKQKAFKIKKIQQRSKRVSNDQIKESLKLDLKTASMSQPFQQNDDEVKIIITAEDKLDSRRSVQPVNKQIEISKDRQRRNSHDGAQIPLPLNQEPQNFARDLDNLTSSKNSKRQQMIGEVFDRINDNDGEDSVDSDERNPPEATSINIQKKIEDSRYPPKIERFLNHMAAQEYDEAEKCLQNFWVESDLLLNPRELSNVAKKQVKFNIQAKAETNAGAQKPPLVQSKQSSLRTSKSKMIKSQSQFKPQDPSDDLQNSPQKEKTQQPFTQPQSTDPSQPSNQFGMLNDLLKLAQKSDQKQNPTSNRKLLSYLQKQMLLDQKIQTHATKSEAFRDQKHQIEKEIENDLNYLNVFVAPIGAINIFQQEQERKEEKPDNVIEKGQTDFDQKIRLLIQASPLKTIIDERVLGAVSDSLRPADQPHGGAMQIQTEALDEVLSCVLPRVRDRTEADYAMQNDIMKQILPFIENLKEIPLDTKDALQKQDNKDEPEDPYLKGIDVATSIASGGLTGKTQDLFDLSRIQEFRKALNVFTDQHELTNDKTAEAMTFLTEQFPNNMDDFDKQQLEKDIQMTRGRFETKSRVKDVIAQAKHFTAEEQARNQKETKYVASQHQKRKLQIEQMLKKLDAEQRAMKDIGNNYILSNSLQQKLIYLSFIECTRLISRHSKSHAMLALKAWHQYFNLAQTEIRRAAQHLHYQVSNITQNIKQLVQTVQTELGKQRIRDMEVLSLKHDYIKTLDLMGILTKNLYQEESRGTSYKLKLNTLEDNLKLVYPYCMEYIMQRENDEPSEHKQIESVVAIGGEGQSDLIDGITKEMRRQIIEKRKDIERQNRQVANFQSQIIYKCGVISTQDNQSEASHSEEEGNAHRAQGPNYLAALSGKLTGQIEKNMHLKRLQQSTSIYDHIVVDIERILAVIPAKIRIQEKLEAANKLISHQKSRIQSFERSSAKADRDIKVLQERCTEIQTEKVQEANKYQHTIFILKKEIEEKTAILLKYEEEKAQQSKQKKSVDEEVQTLVDADTEEILRRREFNQALTKFRGINTAPKKGSMKLSKAAEEALQKGIPPLENIYLPITDVMQKVKRGGSKFMSEKEIKSVKNVLKMIAGLLQAKIAAMDKNDKDVQALMNIDCFFYHHVQQTYGLQQLADRYCETYLASVEAHRKKDTRIELFRKFVGLDLDKLPYSIFERYVQLIKATGVPVQSLFMQNMSTMYVDYSKVRHTFKDLLQDASLHIQKETYKELKKHTKVVTDNLALLRVLDLEDFEVFKDLQEQTIRSRFKSTAAVLQALFMEAGGDEEDGLISDDDDEDTKKRIFVTKGHLAEFLMRNFDLNDYSKGQMNLEAGKTVKRVQGMIDSFFIAGQGLNPNKLSLRELTTGFREKIELRVPAAAYFHIAINARVQLENDENAGYAKMYQFYTQLEVEVDEISGDILAKDVKIQLNLAGMDFQQFVAFLKDADSPLVTETKRQAAYEIYKNTCEPRQRDRLTCEDFIEAIRKYRLIPPIEIIGPAMRRREIEVAKNIRKDLEREGQQVPDVIQNAATADPDAADDTPEEQKDNDLMRLKGANNMGTGQIQGIRVRDLLALSGTAPIVKEEPEEEIKEKEEEVREPSPKKPDFDVKSSSEESNDQDDPGTQAVSSVAVTSQNVTKQSSAVDVTKQSSAVEEANIMTPAAVVSNTADGQQANIIIAGTTPKPELTQKPEEEEKVEEKKEGNEKEEEKKEEAEGEVTLLAYKAHGNDSVVAKVAQMQAEKEEREREEQERQAYLRKDKDEGSDESSSGQQSAEVEVEAEVDDGGGASESEGGSEDD